jgi:HAD superfamily hydrolase (TIGR01549 family)
MSVTTPTLVPVFDLDGTLLDSDAALRDAFVALGVPASAITFGHVLADECDRLGIALADYLAAYDHHAAQPFDGVEDLLGGLGRWAVCSNKHPQSGHDELARLGWSPEVALFADAFSGPKTLGPVLAHLNLGAHEVLFVGDTTHDLACATAVGARFAWAGWNPRATPEGDHPVLRSPLDVLELLV